DYRNVFLFHGLRSCWSTPVFDETHRVLATFAIYFRRPALPEPLHLSLMDIATHVAAIAITRSRAEEKLQRSEQQLRLIYDTVSAVIFLLEVQPDRHFRFVSVNQAFLAATGFRSEQVIGKYVEKIIPPSAQELAFSKYWTAINERRTVAWEESSLFSAGKNTAIVQVTPVFGSQDICTNLVGVVHDRNQFRQAEED
ncbi:MAG TPA: PAS domain S-box protein, partial [Acidobacteriota bacterium]